MTARRTALHFAALFGAASGLTRALRARRHRTKDHRLFILEYHDVSPDDSELEGTIAQARFRRHLRWLKHKFPIHTLRDACQRLASNAGLDHDLLTVTFDDGYEGNFTGAWPVLKSEGVSATVFLTTGFLDGQDLWFDLARRFLAAAQVEPSSLSEQCRRTLVDLYGSWPQRRDPESLVQNLKYLDPKDRFEALGKLEASSLSPAPPARPLSWDQVRTMKDDGIEFGGHTVTHPILSLLPKEEQRVEILTSRQRIHDELGEWPTTFAYPNGSVRDYSEETVQTVREAGFQAACTTRKGSNRPGCDPLTLYRIGIGSDPAWVIEARLSGLFDEQVRRLLLKPRF